MMQKILPLLSLPLILAVTVSFAFWPEKSGLISVLVLIACLGVVIYFIVQEQLIYLKRTESTRSQFARNLTLGILGLLLTLTMASYLGSIVGQWTMARVGLWAGLAAGMMVGFAGAWAVRRAVERLLRRPGQG